MRRAVWAAVAASLAALSLPALLASQQKPKPLFALLHRAEAQALYADADLKRALAQRARAQEDLDEQLVLRDLSRRATSRLRRDLARTSSGWQSVYATLAQSELVMPPGEAGDLRVLLEMAEARRRSAQRRDLRVLYRAGRDDARVADALAARGHIGVEQARAAAEADAARQARTELLAQIRGGKVETSIDAELQRTRRALSRQLSALALHPSTEDFHRLKGTLRPPVSGRPREGYRPGRPGLRYAAALGREVRATQRGVVALVKPVEGFGMLVALDHGAGYISIYGHLGQVRVRPGAALTRGDVLGTVGESESFDGPQLYFELTSRGQHVAVRPWFIRLR